MTTIDTVFIIITAVAISLFFLIFTGLVIYFWILFRRIAKKAELAIEGVESVTELIKEIGGSNKKRMVKKILHYLIMLGRRK